MPGSGAGFFLKIVFLKAGYFVKRQGLPFIKLSRRGYDN